MIYVATRCFKFKTNRNSILKKETNEIKCESIKFTMYIHASSKLFEFKTNRNSFLKKETIEIKLDSMNYTIDLCRNKTFRFLNRLKFIL